MPGPNDTPGSHGTCNVIINGASQEFTVKGEPVWQKNTPRQEQIEDSHSTDPKHMLKARSGKFTSTFITDRDMTPLDTLRAQENGTPSQVVFSLFSGRVVTFTGVTNVTEESAENLATGETAEMTFTYRIVDDRNAS